MEFRIPFSQRKFSLSDVTNVDRSRAERANARRQLIEYQTQRVREDIENWRQALASAESTYTPNRTMLHRIYRDILLDSQISSVVQTRKLNVMSKEFHIIDESGEQDEEATEVIQAAWMRDFIEYVMDSIFWGFSFIELGSVRENRFEFVRSFPRDHFRPETMEIKPHPSDVGGIPADEPPISDWNIFVGSQTGFGLLNELAPLGIWKRSSMGAWAQFNQIYGIPIAIGYTNSRDSRTKDDFEAMLSELHQTTYALLNKDVDEVEIKEATSGQEETFERLVQLVDSSISKRTLGQTMTTDDGSSRAQGEVHERVMRTYEENDMHLVKTIINSELIPRMQRIGMIPEGVSFDWNEREELSLMEQWTIDKELMRNYKVPAEYIQETYGTPVEERSFAATSTEEEVSNILNASVSDFPSEAVKNAQKALSFIKNNPGRGNERSKRLARKITRGEAIGKWLLREITQHARYAYAKDRPFSESDASLNFSLAGGSAMIYNYAPRKLKEVKNTETLYTSKMQELERMYGGA